MNSGNNKLSYALPVPTGDMFNPFNIKNWGSLGVEFRQVEVLRLHEVYYANQRVRTKTLWPHGDYEFDLYDQVSSYVFIFAVGLFIQAPVSLLAFQLVRYTIGESVMQCSWKYDL